MRRSSFSLRSRAIGPLDFDGARREAVLCREDNAWTPVFGVFDKLREVGVSPYLSFIPILSVFPCFGWFEAVRGRLIGPKTWDRNCLNLLKPNGETVAVTGCLGVLNS